MCHMYAPFLGSRIFNREFIPRFSSICEPLNNLTKRGVLWRWYKLQKDAFMRLKELLMITPVLTMFDSEADTVLEADSSGYAIGGVLSQVDKKGRLRPVGFSRKLLPAEANYEIYDKELLSIVATMRYFRGELRSVSKPFIILTDNRNLQHFMIMRQLLERQVRWAEEISGFNFKIKSRSGSDSAKPDLLSRKAEYKPKDFSDEIFRKIEFKLLKINWLSPSYEEEFSSSLSLSAVVT